MNQTQTYTPEDLLLSYIFPNFAPQREPLTESQPDNTCKIEFVTDGSGNLSRHLYDNATIITTMGKHTPTRGFLNDVADTLAADMINYLKEGGSVKDISAKNVYS